MNAKWILTSVLGLFVIVAVGVVALQAVRREEPSARTAPQSVRPAPERVEPPVAEPRIRMAAAVPTPATPAAAPAAAELAPPVLAAEAPVKRGDPPAAPPTRKVVATYFHGNVRCATCRKVEAYAREAVEEGFRSQIAAGTVEFRAVNVEEPANRHFVEEFQLVNRSVVVTEEIEGAPARWVKLDGVWSLVGDHDAYLAYVRDAVNGYLEIE